MLTHLKKKRKEKFSKNNLSKKIGAIVLLIVSLLLIFVDIKIYKNKQKLVLQLNDYKKQIEEIEKRNENLEEGIVKSDDKDFIEKVAREEFGMQQAGENVVAFIESEPVNQEIDNKSKKSFFNTGDWSGWFSSFWKKIKNRF